MIKGHSLTEQLDRVGRGQCRRVELQPLVDRAAKEGAPIRWRPVVEPAFLVAGNGIVKATPRPATAALYIQWALTKAQDST